MPAIRAAAVMKNATQESLRRACRQDQAHGDRPKHFLAPPTASKLLIGSFCKDRTFAVVDENDRVWSTAAGRSWDKSVFQRRLREGLATPKPVIRGTG